MSDPTVIAAIFAAIASICVGILSLIAGIIVAVVGKLPIENFFSRRERQQNNIPEIMQTKWSAEWQFEDGSLYIKDSVTFEKWTKNSQFAGYGEVTHGEKQYKYSIEGEVAPNRIVVLIYKAEKYPLQANIGIACLELSTNAERLVGTWSGLSSRKLSDGTKVEALRHGPIVMHKIKDLKSPGS